MRKIADQLDRLEKAISAGRSVVLELSGVGDLDPLADLATEVGARSLA